MSGIDLPKKSKTKASHCTIIQSTSVLRVFTSSYFTEFNSWTLHCSEKKLNLKYQLF